MSQHVSVNKRLSGSSIKGHDEEGTMVRGKDNEKKSSPFLRQSHDTEDERNRIGVKR